MEEFLHHLGFLNPCLKTQSMKTQTFVSYSGVPLYGLGSPMIDHEVNPAYQQAQQMDREP